MNQSLQNSEIRIRPMSNEGMRSQNQQQQNYNPSPNKGNQKATAVVLSVITCIFMCALGYEIIQLNQNRNSDRPYETAETAHNRKYSYSGSTTSSYNNNDDDEYLNYELKLLRDQNKRQATKIKTLKQEIVDRLQEQHDLKSTLFKQDGDPRDKARIAELGQQLAQKELATVQLQQHLKELETEKQTFERRILHAEVTKEALTTMLEQQRTLRDQEIAKLKIQMAEYQLQKDKENEKILLQLVQYEDTHQRLRENLEDNSYASFYLESEINHLDDELQETKKHRQQTETTLLEQLYNTVAYVELSEIESVTLKKRLNDAYLLHSKSLKENNARISVLEKELKEHRKSLREKNAALDSIHDLYSIALIQIKKQIGEVSNYYEAEKNRSETLEDELAKQVETKKFLEKNYKSLKKDHRLTKEVEKRLEETNEKMAQLEAELETHKLSLVDKEHHLEQLEYGKNVLESRYQDQIQDLANTLKSEQHAKSTLEWQIEYLAGQLELENARHKSTKLALIDLGNTQQLLEDQIHYTLTVEADLEFNKQKAAELQAELEYQRLLVEDKDQQINKNLINEHEKIAALEHEINLHRASIGEKHVQIVELKKSKTNVQSELEDKIYLLTQDLEKEQDHIISLESQLLSVTEQLEKEKEAHEEARLALIEFNETQGTLKNQHRYSITLEKKLQDSQKLVAQLEDQIHNLSAELEIKEQTHQEKLDSENKKMAVLREEIETHKATLSSTEKQLNTLYSSLDTKDEIIGINASLEQVLQQERSQVAHLENLLASISESLEQEIVNHDQTKQQLGNLDGTKQTLQEQLRHTKDIETELQASIQKAAHLQEELDLQTSLTESYEQRVKDLQAQESDQIAQMKREIESHKNALVQKNEVLKGLHGDKQSLESNFQDQISLLQDTLQQDQKRMSGLESEISELTNRLEEEQYQHRLTRNSLAELDSTKRALDDQLKYVQTIENELESNKQKIAQLKETVQFNVSLVESGKQHTAQLEKELDFYTALVESKEQNIRDQEHKEAELNREYLHTIAELTAHSQRESEQARNLEDKLYEMEQQYARAQEHSKELQKTLVKSEQTVSELSAYNQRESEQARNLEEKLYEIEQQYAWEQEHSKDLLKTLAKTEQTVSELSAFNQKESEQARNLEEKLYEIEQRYATEQEHSKDLQETLEKTERSIASLEGELSRFELERRNTSEKIADLEAQVNDLLQGSRARETAEAKRFEKFNHR